MVSPSPCPSPPEERGLKNVIITTTPSPLKGEGWGRGESPMILSNYVLFIIVLSHLLYCKIIFHFVNFFKKFISFFLFCCILFTKENYYGKQ